MSFNYNSDNIQEKGFIDKNQILKYVSEKEIFGLVFKEIPPEYDYILSPFRKDKSPGCWFETDINGKLVFKDFAFGKRPIDCFDAVRLHYKLSNFYTSLEFVYNTLIKNNNNLIERANIKIIKPRKAVEIYFESRNFIPRDGKYWSRYGISKDNLIEDKVFPVKKFNLLNSKSGDITCNVYESCYAYTDFPENRKKLYFPYRKGNTRFITNCRKNDIGGEAPLMGRRIVLGKSYKDYRVIKNQGFNCYWNQNEGMIPDADVLIPKIKGYSDILVWYDNDEAGIKASNKLVDFINKYLPNKARAIWLPEHLNEKDISDPSDLYYKRSEEELKQFIINNI